MKRGIQQAGSQHLSAGKLIAGRWQRCLVHYSGLSVGAIWDVRFGSKADISHRTRHVRFIPESRYFAEHETKQSA